MKTLRETIDQLDEISRRDVLKGAGAAAIAGAAGGVATKANAQQVIQWTKYATDLATKTMGRIHQDTGYDLRNWLVTNVGTWVSDYCTQTNSYNAKEVIDYCNQQGVEASGLDKQNALVTAFLTNMKSRYQDFLTAYRAGIQESYQKFNAAVRSQQQTQQTGWDPKNWKITSTAIDLYIISKLEGNQQVVDQVAKTFSKLFKIYPIKDEINQDFKKATTLRTTEKQNEPERFKTNRDWLIANASKIVDDLDKLTTQSEPEFKESIEQVEEASPDALAKINELTK